MADITARLLWYRIGESSESLFTIWNGMKYVIDTGGTVLNWIFLLWVMLGIILMVLATLKNNAEGSRSNHEYATRNGPPFPHCKLSRDLSSPRQDEDSAKQAMGRSLSYNADKDWFSSVILWLSSEECCWRVPIIDTFLTALTQASKDSAVSLCLNHWLQKS